MSLFIAYPDIPLNAVRIRTDQAYNDLMPHYNLYRGHRYYHAKLASATVADRIIRFTLADNAFQSANYCIISRADLLLADGITNIALASSTNDSTYTNHVFTAIASADLKGTRNQDVIITFPQTASRQFWRFAYSCPSAINKFSKLYFGNLFDIGCAPSDFVFNLEKPQTDTFIADSGAVHTIQTGISKYTLNITWEGVSDLKAQELFSLLKLHAQGVFLYAPVQQQILNNFELLHCRCISFQKEDNDGWPNWNKITCVFEELIG